MKFDLMIFLTVTSAILIGRYCPLSLPKILGLVDLGILVEKVFFCWLRGC